MKKEDPSLLVSAIIPTYNRAHLIGRALESVLNQSYSALELIIIDDGSTDNTEEVVCSYLSDSALPIKYFKKQNGGCASARNKGVDLCTGDVIVFLDSDDLLLPNAIASMVKVLLDSGADFVYSPIINVYNDSHEIIDYPAAAGAPGLFPREHFLTNNAYSCSILYRRAIFDNLRIDEELRYNEDSDFLQRVALNYKAAYVSQPVAMVFHHEENKSRNRVGIYRALLRSSEGILTDYPDFATSLGEVAAERISSIKASLVEQLIIGNRVGEAKEVAVENRYKLQKQIRWSLQLNSSLPLLLARKINWFTVRILNPLKLRTRRAPVMHVMHLFGVYLPMTENWCYRLIKYLPDTQLYIVAERADNEHHFVLPNSLRLIMPTVEWPMAPHSVIAYGTKVLCILLRKFWMWLVSHFAGRSSIVHAHFSYMGWNYLHLAELRQVPMVVSYYGYDYEYLPNRYPAWRERYVEMFRRVSLFVTEGGVGRSKLIAMGCPEEKVKVVHLGVETSLIPFYRRTKESGELRLIQVATFTSKKGHDLTIRAFIIAARSCPGITLTLVGKDPKGIRGALQRVIREADLESQVEFIDGMDFTKLHSFLKPFHLFIHPSRYGNNGDSEGGAPVVLLDAQATGMPVLASTHCDIPEEVIHDATGILVDEGDVDALVVGIERFYRMDGPEYSGFCENARRHIEKNYDAVASGRRLREVYEGIIDGLGRC